MEILFSEDTKIELKMYWLNSKKSSPKTTRPQPKILVQDIVSSFYSHLGSNSNGFDINFALIVVNLFCTGEIWYSYAFSDPKHFDLMNRLQFA
jgi:hypothetical protein